MPQVSATPPGPRNDAIFLRPERRQVVMAVTFGVSLAILIFLSGRHGIGFGSDPVCATLDPQASEVVARLVHERDAAAQARLRDAVARLRRARAHCRHGFVSLARTDYNALLNEFSAAQ